MIPNLSGGIDHVHLYASNREEAAAWYEKNLGFEPVDSLAFWAQDTSGPLTIQNPEGSIHIAIFNSTKQRPFSLAFGASGGEYHGWKKYLKSTAIEVVEKDHRISWSIYFHDPYGNQIEITTYDYDAVSTLA